MQLSMLLTLSLLRAILHYWKLIIMENIESSWTFWWILILKLYSPKIFALKNFKIDIHHWWKHLQHPENAGVVLQGNTVPCFMGQSCIVWTDLYISVEDELIMPWCNGGGILFSSSPTNQLIFSFGRRVIYHSKGFWEYIPKLILTVCTTIFNE